MDSERATRSQLAPRECRVLGRAGVCRAEVLLGGPEGEDDAPKGFELHFLLLMKAGLREAWGRTSGEGGLGWVGRQGSGVNMAGKLIGFWRLLGE